MNSQELHEYFSRLLEGTIKKAGYDRLFPDLYSPSSNNLLGDRLYKELNPLRRTLSISPHQCRKKFGKT